MADDSSKRKRPTSRERSAAPAPRRTISDDELLADDPAAPLPAAEISPPAPEPAAVRAPKRPMPEVDDEDEDETDAPAADPPRPGLKLGRTELVSLAAFGLFVLVSGIVFLKYLYRSPHQADASSQRRVFDLPLKGQIAHVKAVAASWRDKQPGDRVKPEEVVLPRAVLTLDPASSRTGFVRIEFIDSDGTTRGDIVTAALEGGKFKDSGRGEKVSADGSEITVTGTEGFRSEALFSTYLGGRDRRWTVRLREGADYSSGPWIILGEGDLSDTRN